MYMYSIILLEWLNGSTTPGHTGNQNLLDIPSIQFLHQGLTMLTQMQLGPFVGKGPILMLFILSNLQREGENHRTLYFVTNYYT